MHFTAEPQSSLYWLKIPKGHLWLLGDNPKYSKDSRDYGPVPYGLIQGRVCFKVRAGLLVIQRCYVIPN